MLSNSNNSSEKKSCECTWKSMGPYGFFSSEERLSKISELRSTRTVIKYVLTINSGFIEIPMDTFTYLNPFMFTFPRVPEQMQRIYFFFSYQTTFFFCCDYDYSLHAAEQIGKCSLNYSGHRSSSANQTQIVTVTHWLHFPCLAALCVFATHIPCREK